MIMHQENLDYESHWKHQIIEYVQDHDNTQQKKTNAPQYSDCVYICPMYNDQGGHELLHLQTNKVVKRQNLKQVSITPSIIKHV